MQFEVIEHSFSFGFLLRLSPLTGCVRACFAHLLRACTRTADSMLQLVLGVIIFQDGLLNFIADVCSVVEAGAGEPHGVLQAGGERHLRGRRRQARRRSPRVRHRGPLLGPRQRLRPLRRALLMRDGRFDLAPLRRWAGPIVPMGACDVGRVWRIALKTSIDCWVTTADSGGQAACSSGADQHTRFCRPDGRACGSLFLRHRGSWVVC